MVNECPPEENGNIGKDTMMLCKREFALVRALGKREYMVVRARRLMG